MKKMMTDRQMRLYEKRLKFLKIFQEYFEERMIAGEIFEDGVCEKETLRDKLIKISKKQMKKENKLDYLIETAKKETDPLIY